MIYARYVALPFSQFFVYPPVSVCLETWMNDKADMKEETNGVRAW